MSIPEGKQYFDIGINSMSFHSQEIVFNIL